MSDRLALRHLARQLLPFTLRGRIIILAAASLIVAMALIIVIIARERQLAARIDAAKAFLDQAAPSVEMIEVAVGLPGGRGMGAIEAITGRDVANQAEPRATAYRLSGKKK